jgi:hypothetical protein
VLVSDFINHAVAAWDVQKLDAFFLPMDSEVIRSIPQSHRVQSDFWAWHFDRSGIFSVRSCYRVLATMKRTREEWLDERGATSATSANKQAWKKL